MKIGRLGRSGDGSVALKLHSRRAGMGLVWPAFDSPAAGCESSSAERRWYAVRTKARREQDVVGPLAGLMAVIERPCSERGRVRILFDFLRRGASVELPVALIDRV
jgi:hypothetical protein